MPTLAYHVVDVFTDQPFAGNPLAVVLDADDLPTESLQAIAREFHLSETAFPMRSTEADYRLRIFTPVAELPFAGHPSLGSAWLLARLGRIGYGNVSQECGVGILPIEVRQAGATVSGGRPTVGPPLPGADLLPLLGLTAPDLTAVRELAGRLDQAGTTELEVSSEGSGGPASSPLPRMAGAGLDFVYVPVPEEMIARISPDIGAIDKVLCKGLGATGVVVLSWLPEQRHAHVRVFVPGVGEDPATGAAAVGLGVYLAASGLVPAQGTAGYTIYQGAEILRPSRLDASVIVDRGAVTATSVSGPVVHVASGEVRRP